MAAATGTSGTGVSIEIDDIQSGALRPRPVPYVGRFVFLRVDDRHAGRALLRRLLPLIDAGAAVADPNRGAWVAVAFTYQGLRALGVPQESLDSFSPGRLYVVPDWRYRWFVHLYPKLPMSLRLWLAARAPHKKE